jgi:hypothetical protein
VLAGFIAQPRKSASVHCKSSQQNDPNPKEASATGAHTGPFPTSDRRSATADARNPKLEDVTANAYFAGFWEAVGVKEHQHHE